MKRLTTLLFTVLVCMSGKAQMASWVMQPVYDKIHVAKGADILLSDSANIRSLWDFTGKRLAQTADSLHNFRENLAVTTVKGSNKVSGFFDTKGNFIHLKNQTMAFNYPYFSDGYLLVKSGNRFVMVNTKGEEESFGTYIKIYPFSNEFATCFTYKSIEKMREPYYFYVKSNKEPVNFILNEKVVDNEDVEFLSSMSNEGTSIVVIKRKVYFYEKDTGTLKPVFADENETNIKRQVKVSGSPGEYIAVRNDTVFVNAKSNKDEFMTFAFDKMLRPIFAKSITRKVVFEKEVEMPIILKSKFTAVKDDSGLCGLKHSCGYELPAQFDSIDFLLNDFAVVKKQGKLGMLTLNDALKYRFQMNKGNAIAFRHQKYETTIRLDFPTSISAKVCRLEVASNKGCDIDKTSIITKDTESGNFVQYNCVLTIPESLPDVITPITYPVQIVYDGIKYATHNLKVKGWHYKYINVDINDEETLMEKENLSFSLNLTTEKNPGENDYPFLVEAMSDSLLTNLEKISETRYKCKIDSLPEGENLVYIHIIEKGCPHTIFPIEIIYTKARKRTRYKPAVAAQLIVRQKTEANIKQEEEAETTNQ